MATLTLNGSTSGAITLAAPAVAGSNTLTLPAATGTLVTSQAASISGNLTFTGSGNRILGDFSNATLSNRTAFQSSTTNGNTIIYALPNGTSTTSAFSAANNSDPTNASRATVAALSTEARFASEIGGTGTYLPMTFYTNGSEAMRIDTSGNLLVGTTSILFGSNNQISVKGNSTNNSALVGVSHFDGSITGYFNTFGGTLNIGSFTNSSFTFNTNNTERMRIDTNGNVGIGTSSVASAYKIQTYGLYPGIGIQTNQANGGTGGGWIDFLTQGGTVQGNIYFNQANGYMNFGTAASGSGSVERMRIDSSGSLLINRTSQSSFSGVLTVTNSGKTSIGGMYAETTNTNYFALGLLANTGSFNDHVIFNDCARSNSSAFNFMLCRSSSTGAADNEFVLRGDGNGYADGTWNNNGADYAEFFESVNGQALTVGATVVLENNKVREATSQDASSAIIGVVRPKEPSKASMVVGNTAWNKWANKYLTDDFDRYIMEDHDVVEWVDEDGKEHSYESHSIPQDVTVPSDAVYKTHDSKGNKFQHYKINPAWDKDAEYVNRENRPEWNIIGLLGQVKVLKGQPVGERWVKMRDVSSVVEEWFIR